MSELTPYDEPLRHERSPLQLKQVMALYNKPSYFFIDLINKYQILKPERSGEYRGREIYEFRPGDLARIERVIRLQELGYKMKDIKEIMGSDREEYEIHGLLLRGAIEDWQAAPTPENWVNLLLKISARSKDESSNRLLWIRVNQGVGFEDLAREFNLPSAESAREIFREMERKIGNSLMQLLFLGGKRPGN
jgi:DNA-binding transcriptional MerR regulator